MSFLNMSIKQLNHNKRHFFIADCIHQVNPQSLSSSGLAAKVAKPRSFVARESLHLENATNKILLWGLSKGIGARRPYFLLERGKCS